MVSPLLVTKLHLPLPRSPLVQWKRLLEKLNQGFSRKLILVSAAAGFGKTTVLSEWVQQAKLPVGWLSLDERDNDPTRFWLYFVTALQQGVPHLGEATLAMLRSPEQPPFEAFLTPLLNEFAHLQTNLILVLDDYHLITATVIHDALNFVLDHLPTQVHLAVATRVHPPLSLAKLRVRAQLTELGAGDLRFTDAEATIFLHQLLLEPLTEAQIETLQNKTEGWVAGLQLATLSLQETANSASLLDSFKGRQITRVQALPLTIADKFAPFLPTVFFHPQSFLKLPTPNHSPSVRIQGFLFGIGQAQANIWVHRLTGVLNQALDVEQHLPERQAHKLAQVLAACPELEFVIDGTERRINRPKDKEQRDQHYSGKKKATTVKNNLITERRKGGKVKYLSQTVEGKRHDKRLADEENYQFPKGSKLWQDTGFQGYEPEAVTTFQPKKKPRGKALTEEEKKRNRELSSERVIVEHHIGGVKRSRIVSDTFRNRKDNYVDMVMETACGLHNFRVSQRQKAVAYSGFQASRVHSDIVRNQKK